MHLIPLEEGEQDKLLKLRLGVCRDAQKHTTLCLRSNALLTYWNIFCSSSSQLWSFEPFPGFGDLWDGQFLKEIRRTYKRMPARREDATMAKRGGHGPFSSDVPGPGPRSRPRVAPAPGHNLLFINRSNFVENVNF